MKTARWYGILCLSFFLWLLLFPPWMELSRAFLSDKLGTQVSTVCHSLGHHWRFSVPLHWQWRADVRQSFLVPNLAARIDYQRMLYEAAIGFVALALLFLLLSALEMPERIRNWRNRDLKGSKTGVRPLSPNPPPPPDLADALTAKPLGTPLTASEQVVPSPEGVERTFDAKALAAQIIASMPPRPVSPLPLHASGWEEFRDARAAELRGQPPTARPEATVPPPQTPTASSTLAIPTEVRR
jgi:hypothetical protein